MIRNIRINQRADFSLTVTIPANIVVFNPTPLASIAPDFNPAAKVVMTAVRVGSQLTLSLTETQTAALAPGFHRFDCLLIYGAAVDRFVEGQAEVSLGIASSI